MSVQTPTPSETERPIRFAAPARQREARERAEQREPSEGAERRRRLISTAKLST
jgi:hypothetical protein